jgi:predicted DNA binding CopG/RHH family protein
MKKQLNTPKFKSEDQEREFWSKIDLADYIDPIDFISVSFPNLKPSSRPVSVRLPQYLLMRLKERANELSIPYQTLMKQYIAAGVIGK